MSLREELLQLKVKELLKHEDEHPFPLFMKLLRKTQGITRTSLAKTLDVSESKIFYLEKGVYRKRGPDPEFITTLAHFYGVSSSFVLEKLNDYLKAA